MWEYFYQKNISDVFLGYGYFYYVNATCILDRYAADRRSNKPQLAGKDVWQTTKAGRGKAQTEQRKRRKGEWGSRDSSSGERRGKEEEREGAATPDPRPTSDAFSVTRGERDTTHNKRGPVYNTNTHTFINTEQQTRTFSTRWHKGWVLQHIHFHRYRYSLTKFTLNWNPKCLIIWMRYCSTKKFQSYLIWMTFEFSMNPFW